MSKFDFVFGRKPKHWGLRGDEYLWDEMFSMTNKEEWPTSQSLFLDLIRRLFYDLVGQRMEDGDPVYIERYDTGIGMSTGMISRNWWSKEGIEILLKNYVSVK
jgi:hypothetical protein